MHTNLGSTCQQRQSVYGSPRDYAIFTGWVNGVTQAALAREFGLSANRISQIVGRFNRYYDSGAGKSFYDLINRMLTTRPMIYPVLQPSSGRQVLLCSVIVPDPDYLYNQAICRNLFADLSVGELPWAVRKAGPARTVTAYLNSVLEQ